VRSARRHRRPWIPRRARGLKLLSPARCRLLACEPTCTDETTDGQEVVGARHKTLRNDSEDSDAVADQPHRNGYDGECVDPERGISSKRFPAVTDVIVNFSGATTGMVAGQIIRRLRLGQHRVTPTTAEAGQISLRPTGSQSVSNGVIGRRSPVRVQYSRRWCRGLRDSAHWRTKGPRSGDNEDPFVVLAGVSAY
jgi:hypothetical protein